MQKSASPLKNPLWSTDIKGVKTTQVLFGKVRVAENSSPANSDASSERYMRHGETVPSLGIKFLASLFIITSNHLLTLWGIFSHLKIPLASLPVFKQIYFSSTSNDFWSDLKHAEGNRTFLASNSVDYCVPSSPPCSCSIIMFCHRN